MEERGPEILIGKHEKTELGNNSDDKDDSSEISLIELNNIDQEGIFELSSDDEPQEDNLEIVVDQLSSMIKERFPQFFVESKIEDDTSLEFDFGGNKVGSLPISCKASFFHICDVIRSMKDQTNDQTVQEITFMIERLCSIRSKIMTESGYDESVKYFETILHEPEID